MKKAADRRQDELRREYDLSKFKGRVRGKHYKTAKAGTNLVLLELDVADIFPDATAVNEALRMLAKVANRTPGRGGSRKKRA